MEQYATPRESLSMTAPVSCLPAIARDLLDALGLSPSEGNKSDGPIACFHGAQVASMFFEGLGSAALAFNEFEPKVHGVKKVQASK